MVKVDLMVENVEIYQSISLVAYGISLILWVNLRTEITAKERETLLNGKIVSKTTLNWRQRTNKHADAMLQGDTNKKSNRWRI